MMRGIEVACLVVGASVALVGTALLQMIVLDWILSRVLRFWRAYYLFADFVLHRERFKAWMNRQMD